MKARLHAAVQRLMPSRAVDWAAAFRDYALAPERVWPQERITQSQKLERRRAELAERLGASKEAAVDWVLAAAASRAAARPATIFLTNCGSSGSHWLEAMMADTPGIAPCGEVYLPKELSRELDGWHSPDRSAFLDCVHLLHADDDPAKVANACLVNSAHMSGLRMARMMDSPKWVVLLVRDPVDIVISRTFRKQDYRDFVRPSASDAEYLRTNIEFVDKFFRTMATEAVDATVRYEDLRRDAPATLGMLLTRLGHAVTPDELSRIAQAYSADAQRNSGSGAAHRSNLYRGPEVTVPEAFRRETEATMKNTRQLFHYAPAET